MVKAMPKAGILEAVRQVPRVETQEEERSGEVPHVKQSERIIEVPQLQIQGVAKFMPRV